MRCNLGGKSFAGCAATTTDAGITMPSFHRGFSPALETVRPANAVIFLEVRFCTEQDSEDFPRKPPHLGVFLSHVSRSFWLQAECVLYGYCIALNKCIANIKHTGSNKKLLLPFLSLIL
jgi:hypothetical protein